MKLGCWLQGIRELRIADKFQFQYIKFLSWFSSQRKTKILLLSTFRKSLTKKSYLFFLTMPRIHGLVCDRLFNNNFNLWFIVCHNYWCYTIVKHQKCEEFNLTIAGDTFLLGLRFLPIPLTSGSFDMQCFPFHQEVHSWHMNSWQLCTRQAYNGDVLLACDNCDITRSLRYITYRPSRGIDRRPHRACNFYCYSRMWNCLFHRNDAFSSRRNFMYDRWCCIHRYIFARRFSCFLVWVRQLPLNQWNCSDISGQKKKNECKNDFYKL